MRSIRLSLVILALAPVAALGGCGGGDTTAACDNIQKEIQNVSTNGLKQVNDPKGLAKTYSDAATKIRAEGEKAGGDVESAANDVATAMDNMGKQVAAGTGQMPDIDPLTNAGIKLKNACT